MTHHINGGHHLIEMKEVPEEIVALRRELMEPWNAELVREAMKGESFEECLGIIAFQLGIPLNGNYHIPQLCGKLYEALKQKRLLIN